MYRKVLLILLIFLQIQFAKAQPIYFEKNFGGPDKQTSRSLVELSTGSIFLLGNSASGSLGGNDIVLVKVNASGNYEWVEYYGTFDDNNGFFITKTADGNLLFVGDDMASSNNLDVLLYKTDTTGTIIWNKTYGTGINESIKNIIETSDGSIIGCGFINDAGGSNDMLLMKLNSDGDLIWQKNYGGIGNEYAQLVAETPEGNYLLIGDTDSKGAGSYDINVIKTDTAGNIIWNKTFGDNLANGSQGILVTSTNKYLVYGETRVGVMSSPFECYLQMLDTSGASIWQQNIGGTGTDAAFYAVEENNNSFALSGYSNSNDDTTPINILFLKIDSLGNNIHQKYFGGDNVDIGYQIANSIGGGFLITGKYTSATNTDDYYILHIDTSGVVSIPENVTKQNSINVFPNPSSNHFKLKNNTDKEMDCIEIFNSLGVTCYRKETIIKPNQDVLISTDLAQGIYFLRTSSNSKKENFVQKIIIH